MNVLTQRRVDAMKLETKYLRHRTPVTIGSRLGDWQVCWLGGWRGSCQKHIRAIKRRQESVGSERLPRRMRQRNVSVPNAQPSFQVEAHQLRRKRSSQLLLRLCEIPLRLGASR
jgi:hypothetical protein